MAARERMFFIPAPSPGKSVVRKPFPSSLMLGCYAQALSRDFEIDGHEIAAARWLTKEEARTQLAHPTNDEMKLPVTIAIAHYLIKDWASR